MSTAVSSSVSGLSGGIRSTLGRDNSGTGSLIHSPVRGQIGNGSDGACCSGCSSSSAKSGCGAKKAGATGLAARGPGIASDGAHEGVSQGSVILAPRSRHGWGSEGAHEGVSKASVIHAPRSKHGQQSVSVGCGVGGGCAGRCAKDGLGACSTRSNGQLIDADSMARLPKGWHGRMGGSDDNEITVLSPGFGSRRPRSSTQNARMDYGLTYHPKDPGPAPDLPATDCACDTPAISISSDVRDEVVVTVKSACSEFDDIIKAAWQLLLDNQEVLSAAAEQYLWSADEFTDLLQGFTWVLGIKFRIPVSITCEDLLAADAVNGRYSADTSGHHIKIDIAYLTQLQTLWESARSESGQGRRKGQMCAALDLAAILAHELTHTLGYAFGDTADGHFVSYLVGNYFRYHAMRNNCVIGWGCCNWRLLGEQAANPTADPATYGNYNILVFDEAFNSDTYRIDTEDPGGPRHNVCRDGNAEC